MHSLSVPCHIENNRSGWVEMCEWGFGFLF